MANNITVKDSTGTTKTIHTVEDSTSAHFNMSVPVDVSGHTATVVSGSGQAATTGMGGLVVALHPSSPLPVGTNLLGGVSVRGIVTVAGPVSIGGNIPGIDSAITVNAHAVTQSGPWRVSVTDPLPAGTNLIGAVSIRGNVSIDDKVSVAGLVSAHQDGTWNVISNTQLVSIGGATSIQAYPIAGKDTAGDARIPLMTTGGALIVHVSNTAPGGAAGSTQMVSIGGATSVQAVQIAGKDTAGNARSPLMFTDGTLLVHVCNAQPTPTGTTQMVSIGGAVSNQAVQIAGKDTAGDARIPLMTTGGALIVHVSNTAPGGAAGSTQMVSIGGTVSNQAVQVAFTDGTNARTPYSDSSGIQRVSVMDSTLAVTQSGTWTVQPGNTANTTPWLVSVGGNVSLSDNAPVSVRGGILGAVSLGGGTAQIGRVSVFVDQVPFNVSVMNSLPVPVSIVGGVLGAVSLGGGTAIIGKVSLAGINPVSVAGNIPGIDSAITVGTHAVTQSGTWTVQPGNTANTTPWLVSVGGNVSLSDNAPVSVRGGRVSIADSTLAATQSGTWTVQPGNTANTTPWLVSVGGNVSLSDNAPVSVRGGVLGAVSLGGGTAQIGRVSVFVDQVPFNVSVMNTLPVPVSIVGGIINTIQQVSLGGGTATIGKLGVNTDKVVIGAVSIADTTHAVTQSGTWTVQPGNTANTTPWLVSVGGNVSLSDNAPVSVRGGRVSIADSTLAVTESGTWTVQPGNTANTTPWLVSVNGPLPAGTNLLGRVSLEGSLPVTGITQMVSIGGAVSNQAVQIAFTDGTNARTPLTTTTGIQIAHVSNVLPDHGVTQSGTWTVQPGNTANTTPWLVSVGGNVSLSDNAPVSVRGGVLGAVSIGGGTAQIGRVSVFVDQVPFNVSVMNSLPVPTSVVGGVLNAVSIGGGTAQIGRVSVFVDQVPFNVSVMNSLPVPVSIVGGKVHVSNILPDHGVTQSGTWTVQPGNTPNTAPWLTTDIPSSVGGLTISSYTVSAVTSGSLVKSAAGQVYSIAAANNGAGALYLRLFNKATAPASTDTPFIRLIVPGNTAGAGFVYSIPCGLAFGTGIGWRISGGLVDGDTTAPADNQGYVNILYK